MTVSQSILNGRCRRCGKVFPYPATSAGSQMECPFCGNSVLLTGHAQAVASKRRMRQTSPLGLALEIAGFVLLMVFPLGTITGIVLIVIGWRQSYVVQCGHCEAVLPSAEVQSCPRCHVPFLDA